jgi:hypothetical protein
MVEAVELTSRGRRDEEKRHVMVAVPECFDSTCVLCSAVQVITRRRRIARSPVAESPNRLRTNVYVNAGQQPGTDNNGPAATAEATGLPTYDDGASLFCAS